MSELFKLILNNQTLLYILYIFVSLIVVVILFLLYSAVRGREVTFFPPKVSSATDTKTDKRKYIELIQYKNAYRADAYALDQADYAYDFMGISAQYLYTREGFKDIISAKNKMKCKFLLLNPDSPYVAIVEKREGIKIRKNIISSIENLLHLKKENPFIEIRLYSSLPTFRITIVDSEFCCIGFYSNTVDNSQLSFSKKGKVDSFYIPFKSYFDETWDASTEYNYTSYKLN